MCVKAKYNSLWSYKLMKQVFVDMDLNHFEFYVVALFPKTYFCLHLSSEHKYFKLYCLKILMVKKKKYWLLEVELILYVLKSQI